MTCPHIKVPVGKWLSCSCCGTGFKAWKGYVHQDQDQYYGICKECQGIISDHDRAEMDKCITTVSQGLNDKNQARYEAMPRDQQEYLVGQAFDEGILKYEIKRGAA